MLQSQMGMTNQVSLAGAQGRRSSLQLAKMAGHAYRNARLGAGLGRLWALLTGRQRRLLSLKQVLSERRVRGSHHGGTRAVSISQIRGSEGRSGDFDAQFRPLEAHTKGKWMSVALARLKGVALPAVKLAQVGEDYYVIDGHHRISVARAFGQEIIDAEVTVWEVEAAPVVVAAGQGEMALGVR